MQQQASFSVRDRIIPIVTVTLVTLLLALLAYAIFGDRSGPVQQRGGVNSVGQYIAVDRRQAPDFSVEGFNGETVSMADFAGKNVILNFWASWCEPCMEEAPVFAELDRTLGDDTVVVGIAVWDSESASRGFLTEYGLTYPNAPSTDGKIAIDYGVAGVPETFFINKEGQIVGKYPGEITSVEQVEGILADINHGG